MATMMVDRSGMMGIPGMSSPAMGGAMGMGAPGGAPMMPGMGMMMVPRCTIVIEKCAGGMTMTCKCDDKMSAGMLQSLCTMLAGSGCSCYMMMNGMMACCCNLIMGMCKSEMTDDGVKMTCTSGDPACCAMIQSCCDCMTSMMKAGCTCCLCLGNTPVCCGC
jgi:hypothetical protein